MMVGISAVGIPVPSARGFAVATSFQIPVVSALSAVIATISFLHHQYGCNGGEDLEHCPIVLINVHLLLKFPPTRHLREHCGNGRESLDRFRVGARHLLLILTDLHCGVKTNL